MTHAEMAAFVQECFLELALSKETRLRNGAARRIAMAKSMAEGNEATGPRAEWIKTTIRRLVATLATAGQEFNDSNPDDMISVEDMLDTLISTAAMFKKK